MKKLAITLVLGFVVFTVFMAVVGAAWAWLYNYIVGVSVVRVGATVGDQA